MKTNKRKMNTITNPNGTINKNKAENLIKILAVVGILGIILISGCVDEKPDSDNKEWVEISIFCQCCKEPWGNDNNIKPFFEEKGIKIYDIKITKRVVCEACNCPSYEKKEVLIDSKDKGKLLEILSNYPNETSEECKLTDEEAISISDNTSVVKAFIKKYPSYSKDVSSIKTKNNRQGREVWYSVREIENRTTISLGVFVSYREGKDGKCEKKVEFFALQCNRKTAYSGEKEETIIAAIKEGVCRNFKKPPAANDTNATPSITNVIDANNQFAFDLYSELSSEEGNIFFSPYSISTALSMTYEGARGKTADEMQKVLHLPNDKEKMRSDFKDIYNELNKANNLYDLSVANALWAQKDYKFLDEYFKTIEKYYGGKVTNLDFVKETEKSRQTINNWVENQTNNKIKDLIPPGVLNPMTRLVITNAIYFKGTWKWEFDKNDTREMNFYVNSTNTVKTQMMFMKPDKARFNYVDTGKVQILELPYKGDKISMLIILPKQGKEYDYKTGKAITYNYTLKDINLSYENLKKWKTQMEETELEEVYIPKFKLETKYFMNKILSDMGMPTAFSGDADFSGMTGSKDLFIGHVIHQAYVDVNEEGTEAAAATAVVMYEMAMAPTKIFKADHPFIFIIQDKETGNILFIGRVVDPTE